MNISYSSYLKASKDLMKTIINELNKTFEYVSILGVDTIHNKIIYLNNQFEIKPGDWEERGFVIRVFNGNNYFEYSFNELNDTKINDIIEIVKDKGNEYKNTNVKFKNINEDSLIKDFTNNYGESKDLNMVIDYLKELLDYSFQTNKDLVDIDITYNEVFVSKIFLSNKKELEQNYFWNDITIIPMVKKDMVMKYIVKSITRFNGYCDNDSIKTMFKDALLLLSRLFGCEKIDAGYYDVISNPSVSGLIAHEAFGHGVEMDLFYKNRALAETLIGKQIASKNVTLIDGGIKRVLTGSYYFDDDGILNKDTVIIKDGILLDGINDIISATNLNVSPTGNGRRQSFERRVYTRMSNTYFESGPNTLEEMIKSIDYGYLLSNEISGMEDPKHLRLQCIVLVAEEIKNGVLTGRIFSPVLLSGSVLELFNSISMISNNVELSSSGACAKGEKEFVKVSAGGPYLKMKGWLS